MSNDHDGLGRHAAHHPTYRFCCACGETDLLVSCAPIPGLCGPCEARAISWAFFECGYCGDDLVDEAAAGVPLLVLSGTVCCSMCYVESMADCL